MAARKQSVPDLKSSPIRCAKGIDENVYCHVVLRLPAEVTEQQLEQSITAEAKGLGLEVPNAPNTAQEDALVASMSVTTIGSDQNITSSSFSQSTGPTSCASSERRPNTLSSASRFSDRSPTQSTSTSMLSEIEKKKPSGFRNGIRKMTGFKKRRSEILGSTSPLPYAEINTKSFQDAEFVSMKTGIKSPVSMQSRKSSYSNPLSSTRETYEDPNTPADAEGKKRTLECQDLQNLRTQQLDERERFLQFQRSAITELRAEHQSIKQRLFETHSQAVQEAREKNERSAEELESRQLEAELKLVEDLEHEKRTCLIRLRHMEAYCHSPSPPPTPSSSSLSRPSNVSTSDKSSTRSTAPNLPTTPDHIPARKVTQRDYHNLAQQYRERDNMEALHNSKIEVLRGRQEKAHYAFLKRKEREIIALEAANGRALEKEDKRVICEEVFLLEAFEGKRSKLAQRWRLQAEIERKRQERTTGLSYAPLEEFEFPALDCGS